MCHTGRCGLASLFHLPCPISFRRNRPLCRLQSCGSQNHSHLQSSITHGAERALSHSWDSEKPTTGDVLLLSCSLAWSCPRTSLCLKGNFSSRCCGDCSFRLYQIRSHLSLLSPNTRNKVPGRRRPRQEGPHVSWWLPHWEVTAGREQLGLHRQVAAFVNPAQQSCPSICSQLLRTNPILGPHRASARIFPQAPQRALSSSTMWLVCIKHMAFLGCVSSLRKGMELASHIRLWETGL